MGLLNDSHIYSLILLAFLFGFFLLSSFQATPRTILHFKERDMVEWLDQRYGGIVSNILCNALTKPQQLGINRKFVKIKILGVVEVKSRDKNVVVIYIFKVLSSPLLTDVRLYVFV